MQCQDCDASEKITIAGKEFCANCGTMDGATVNTSDATSATSMQAAQAPAGVVAPQTFALPAQVAANQPVPAVADPSPQVQVEPPTSPPIANPQATSSATTSAPAPVVVNSAPVQMQQVQSVSQPPVPQVSSNELGTLSNRGEEGVFSDDQLSALASVSSYTNNTTPPATPKPPAKIKHMGDIRPAGVKTPAQTSSNLPQPTNEPTVVPSGLAAQNQQVSNPSAPMSQQSAPRPRQEHVAPQIATDMASQDTNQQANTLLDQVDTASPDKPKSDAKNRGGKIASVGLSLAGIALLGFYVWQINYPNLALKVAASKAGISASLPSYVPSGWKVAGDIQTNPGSISYSLKTKDNKTLTVNEVRSDWDSQALAENYLRDKTDKYTALQAEGLTIYMYNNNQASWINQGSWYRIEGNDHGLSQEDIIKMATSL